MGDPSVIKRLYALATGGALLCMLGISSEAADRVNTAAEKKARAYYEYFSGLDALGPKPSEEQKKALFDKHIRTARQEYVKASGEQTDLTLKRYNVSKMSLKDYEDKFGKMDLKKKSGSGAIPAAGDGESSRRVIGSYSSPESSPEKSSPSKKADKARASKSSDLETVTLDGQGIPKKIDFNKPSEEVVVQGEVQVDVIEFSRAPASSPSLDQDHGNSEDALRKTASGDVTEIDFNEEVDPGW